MHTIGESGHFFSFALIHLGNYSLCSTSSFQTLACLIGFVKSPFQISRANLVVQL